jgi:hypothetical protein
LIARFLDDGSGRIGLRETSVENTAHGWGQKTNKYEKETIYDESGYAHWPGY